MLGHPTSFSAQLAAERHDRFAAEASRASWRRLSRVTHDEPRCGALAVQLPDAVVDLRTEAAAAQPSVRT
jgi:hypothetical protein